MAEPSRGRAVSGVRLALTTLTVIPLRGGAPPIDRATAAVAMTIAPYVGAALGLVLAGGGLAATAAGASPLLAAVLTVGAGVLLSRGLHIDGLADTADALGSYADRERALAIMRRPDVGPFGVAAIVLVLLAQVAGAATVLDRPWPAALCGVVAATAAGRLAIAAGCRRGIPAARPDGLGAAVAASVSPPALALSLASVMAVSIGAVPDRPWQGPVAVVASFAAAALLIRHAVRRLGGVTGDVLGASCELAVTVVYLGSSI